VEVFVDEGLEGITTYFYRLAAVDTNGNVSEPTSTRAGRAVDTSVPEPPEWIGAEWNEEQTGIDLVWNPAEVTHQVLVQRRSQLGGVVWLAVTGWLPPGESKFYDPNVSTYETYTYRLAVRSISGNQNTAYNEVTVLPVV
jgi:hypothetical protein